MDKADIIEAFGEAEIKLGEHPNGDADMLILDPTVYPDLMDELRLGRGYQDKRWVEGKLSIDEITVRRVKGRLYQRPIHLTAVEQSLEASLRVVHHHYDTGQPYYDAIFDDDKYKVYSSGYYGRNATTNAEAQIDKVSLAGEKGCRSGMRVLDIGGGCGGLAVFLAMHYDVDEVVMITLSAVQAGIARQLVEAFGVAHKVTVIVCDYRRLSSDIGLFDCIASVGMLEHVGSEHYSEFFEVCDSVLKPGGNIVLHFIWSRPVLNRVTDSTTNAWIHAEDFPGGEIPTKALVIKAFARRFVAMDWHDFGEGHSRLHDYARTCIAWDENLVRNWSRIEGEKMPDGRVYDKRFFRTKHYAFGLYAGLFQSGMITVGQVHLFRQQQSHYQIIR